MTTLSKSILALAIMGGAGLMSLSVASHVRGAPASINQRGSPIMRPIALPSAKSAYTAADPSGAQSSSPVLASATFRFGFLEFEDDARVVPKEDPPQRW
jgi:hypothetical protein